MGRGGTTSAAGIGTAPGLAPRRQAGGRVTRPATRLATRPATRLARQAVEAGGAAPAVLNAANEVAVAAFLAGQIPFTRIAAYVADVLAASALPAPASLADVIAVDSQARATARALMEPA